ncbi:MAG: hypothetical protein HY741_25305 [Chloroflexi bacterium]|nr:hypothetical protein [Chloroflexota bacterium]
MPKFKNVAEEADFWDKNSPENFPDEFETVEVAFKKPLRIRLAVPLEAKTVRQLERIGKARGIEPSLLVRDWILERLALLSS